MTNHEERGSVRLPTSATTNQFATDQPALINRADHEAECARLKRLLALRDELIEKCMAELECRRKAQPGWSYNPRFGLYSDGTSLGDLDAIDDGIE